MTHLPDIGDGAVLQATGRSWRGRLGLREFWKRSFDRLVDRVGSGR